LEHCDDRRCRCGLELRYDGNAVKLRYEMAADFTAAVRALWDSWDDGAAAGSNEGAQILRRPYSYNDGVDFTIERWAPWRQGVEYDAGLLFVCHQLDLRTGFI
jgi:deferrochelatase/peroxidase EfeB